MMWPRRGCFAQGRCGLPEDAHDSVAPRDVGPDVASPDAARLRALLDVLTPRDGAGAGGRAALRSATTVEELFEFVDREFG